MGLFDKIREPIILKEGNSLKKQLEQLEQLLEQAEGDLKGKIQKDIYGSVSCYLPWVFRLLQIRRLFYRIFQRGYRHQPAASEAGAAYRHQFLHLPVPELHH